MSAKIAKDRKKGKVVWENAPPTINPKTAYELSAELSRRLPHKGVPHEGVPLQLNEAVAWRAQRAFKTPKPM